ncbi:hypothetical protein Pflav_072640 [Phytohabitans flavus]|uniref:S-adenosyl-L-homocysteine hydrolase NAD binding domain-containing protein n=1 Tax=Phytohabitans flavus TaxID=1076124 RepID=A0A6F8Y403_9ACTN|nr:hypothetical protein Pflav_072640 [Phytohabitans flavus]
MNDSVTKSKFDNKYGIRHSLVDGLNRATDVMLGGKLAVVCGFGDVGKGAVESLRGQGARVVVTEIDPICALQAAMEGLQVVQLEDVVEQADIFITTTGGTDIIMAEQMARMKHNAIVANVGHFDTEIDMAGLGRVPGIVKTEVKPQVHEWLFPDGHAILVLSEGRLMNLGNATGHPSFVMSNSFTNQTMAQIELFTKPGEYETKVYTLPKHLDEKVARLHLDALGVRLTTLTKKQAEYLGVDIEGPTRPSTTATDPTLSRPGPHRTRAASRNRLPGEAFAAPSQRRGDVPALFHPPVLHRLFGDHGPAAVAPDHRRHDQAEHTGAHQDPADDVDVDAAKARVDREGEDRADRDQEHAGSDTHEGLLDWGTPLTYPTWPYVEPGRIANHVLFGGNPATIPASR